MSFPPGMEPWLSSESCRRLTIVPRKFLVPFFRVSDSLLPSFRTQDFFLIPLVESRPSSAFFALFCRSWLLPSAWTDDRRPLPAGFFSFFLSWSCAIMQDPRRGDAFPGTTAFSQFGVRIYSYFFPAYASGVIPTSDRVSLWRDSLFLQGVPRRFEWLCGG